MIASIKSSNSPIGVDIGAHAVKLMQLKGLARHAPRIAAAAHYRRDDSGPPTEATVAQLVQVLQRRGFRGRRLVVATPRSYIKTSLLELPAINGSVSLAQLSRMEMARIHHLQPQSFELAFWPVVDAGDKPKNKATVMAHACTYENANELLDLFARFDLEVEAMDVTTCATARGCGAVIKPDAGSTLIVDLGWSCCRIAAMRGRVVAYERTVDDIGLEPVHQRIAALLGDDAEAATHVLNHVGLDAGAGRARVRPDVQHVLQKYASGVVEELRYCVEYMQRRSAAQTARLMLIGGGADIPGMVRAIGEKSAMNAESVTPGATVTCPDSLIQTCNSAAMTCALGLACHGGGPMP